MEIRSFQIVRVNKHLQELIDVDGNKYICEMNNKQV